MVPLFFVLVKIKTNKNKRRSCGLARKSSKMYVGCGTWVNAGWDVVCTGCTRDRTWAVRGVRGIAHGVYVVYVGCTGDGTWDARGMGRGVRGVRGLILIPRTFPRTPHAFTGFLLLAHAPTFRSAFLDVLLYMCPF